jgi:CXXC-20-CXXC protein
MAKCKNCSHQFSWGEAFGSNITGFKDINCENCKAVNHPDSIYKVAVTLLDVGPLLLFGFVPAYIPMALIVSVLLISPFFAKYELSDT